MREGTEGAEPGLRARKKRETNSLIVANAIRIFSKVGIRRAQLSEVARASHVSPATLFNYFPNKGTLAEAWVRGEIGDVFEQVAGDSSDHGLRSTIRSLCRSLASLVAAERPVRLEAWHATGRAATEPLPPRHPIVCALVREQERERVRADLSAQTLGEMLIDAIEGGLIAALRAEATESETAKAIQSRVDLVLDGARKKNERVAAPLAAAGLQRDLGTPRPTSPARNT